MNDWAVDTTILIAGSGKSTQENANELACLQIMDGMLHNDQFFLAMDERGFAKQEYEEKTTSEYHCMKWLQKMYANDKVVSIAHVDLKPKDKNKLFKGRRGLHKSDQKWVLISSQTASGVIVTSDRKSFQPAMVRDLAKLLSVTILSESDAVKKIA